MDLWTELPVLCDGEPTRITPKTSPQPKSDSVVRCFEDRDLWSLLFGGESFSDFGVLRRHVKQLPASRTPKAWGKHERNVVPAGWCHSSHGESIDGSCSTHIPPTCDLPFQRCFFAPRSMDLSICDFFCRATSRLECTRTDHARLKSWNFPFVKKSQLCRKKCWSVWCRTLTRGSECVAQGRHLIFFVRNLVRTLKFLSYSYFKNMGFVYYALRFKLSRCRREGNRGRYYYYSGVYKQIGVERVYWGGWKTDPRGFFSGRLPRSTRKCTHILR